jgi:cbb3-type cytochrome oxidase maturation protein
VEVLILQVFVSLVLVGISVLAFAYSVRRRDYEHADRLALFPLEEDAKKPLTEQSK